jgi:hypothetical protein
VEVAAVAAGATVPIGAADLAGSSGAPGAPVPCTILQLSHDNICLLGAYMTPPEPSE